MRLARFIDAGQRPSDSPPLSTATRRGFLQASAAIGGGLLLSFGLPQAMGRAAAAAIVSARFDALAARLDGHDVAWKSTETSQDVPVDSPDTISVAGVLKSGAEVSVHVAAIPFHPSGTRLEIYGRDGTMVSSAPGAFNIGPNVLYGAQGTAPLAEMPAPAQYTLVPEGTPPGPPRNVAQAYMRAAHAFGSGTGFEVDFDLAVTRHKLIDAIERSAAEEHVVEL